MNPRRAARVAGRAVVVALLLTAFIDAGHAASLPRTCETEEEPDAPRLALSLRVAAAVRAELDRQGAEVALVARSGLDLQRFGLRYSHAGFSLREHPQGRWTVRQLYFACEEGRPRIFDQGLAAFLLGNDRRANGHLVVLVPGATVAGPLARAAADDVLARRLLGASYSANAHSFATRHQNCNQWVAELMAAALGGTQTPAEPRAQAQDWLRRAGFEPTVFELAWPPLRPLAALIPWLREDDHPDEDLQGWRYRVTMPESIERFTRRIDPGLRRLEFCHDGLRLTVREGWEMLPADCAPGPGDRVIELQGSPPRP